MDGDREDQDLDNTFIDTTHVNNQADEENEPLSGRTIPTSSRGYMSEESSQSNSLPFLGQSLGSSRSRIESHTPIKFIDYIIEGKYKYGILRSVNYSYLNNENRCFVSNLNKTIEPKTYEEASLDHNWIKAMNDEIEALYHNHTWDIIVLPKNCKSIGCK